MNKERRKALLDIMVQLEELKSSIEEIQEEDESRENMPENVPRRQAETSPMQSAV